MVMSIVVLMNADCWLTGVTRVFRQCWAAWSLASGDVGNASKSGQPGRSFGYYTNERENQSVVITKPEEA